MSSTAFTTTDDKSRKVSISGAKSHRFSYSDSLLDYYINLFGSHFPQFCLHNLQIMSPSGFKLSLLFFLFTAKIHKSNLLLDILFTDFTELRLLTNKHIFKYRYYITNIKVNKENFPLDTQQNSYSISPLPDTVTGQ